MNVGRVYPSLAMALKSVVYSFGIENKRNKKKTKILEHFSFDPDLKIHMDEKRTSHIKNHVLEARLDEPRTKEAIGSTYKIVVHA